MPLPRPVRLVARAVVVLSLLAAALALILLAARKPLLARFLRGRLGALGLEVTSLEVSDLGLHAARLERIDLARGELGIEALTVGYRPLALLTGPRLDRVAVQGLRARLDLRQALPSRAPGAGDDVAGRVAALLSRGSVEIADARVAVQTPFGPGDVRLSGSAGPDPEGQPAARFRVEIATRDARLRGAVSGRLDRDGDLEARLLVEDGEAAPWGVRLAELAGSARARIVSGALAELEGWLTARSLEREGRSLGPVAMEARLLAEHLRAGELALEVQAERGRSSLRATFQGRYEPTPESTGPYELSADLDLDGADLAGLEPLPVAGAQAIRLSLAGRGRLPATPALVAALGCGDRIGLLAGFAGLGRLELHGLDVPGRAARLDAAADVHLHGTEEGLRLVLAPALEVAATRLDRRWLEALGVPGELAATAAGGARLRLASPVPARPLIATLPRAAGPRASGTGDLDLRLVTGGRLAARADVALALGPDLGPLRLAVRDLRLAASSPPLAGFQEASLRATGSVSARPGRATGRLDLSLAATRFERGSTRATGISAALPVSLDLDGGLQVILAAPGEVRIKTAGMADRLRLSSPLVLALPEGRARLSRGRGGMPGAVSALRARWESLDLVLPAPDAGAPRRLQGAGELRLGLEDGVLEAHLDARRLALSSPAIALAALHASLSLAPEPRLRFEIPRLLFPDLSPLPVRLEGEVRSTGPEALFRGAATLAGGAVVMDLEGSYEADVPRATLRLAARPVDLADPRLRPGDLSPLLAPLRHVEGHARATASLAWEPGSLGGQASLSVKDASFQVADLTVRGLSTEVALDSLWPPGSPPGQLLEARRVEAGLGLPLTGLAMRFALEPGPPAGLRIESLEAGLAGGRLVVPELRLAGFGAPRTIRLKLEALDLGQLAGILGLEGLSIEGRVSGEIPLTGQGDALVVEQGQLDALAPGVFRYRSDRARQALSAGGESVALLLEALEDFHYRELHIEVARSAGDDAQIRLGLLGANPRLLDGYPFRINLRLAGNTRSLLAALSEAYRLKSFLLERSFRKHRRAP